jgi:hypothetical protein
MIDQQNDDCGSMSVAEDEQVHPEIDKTIQN